MKSEAKVLWGWHTILVFTVGTLMTGVADPARAQQSVPPQAAATAKTADPLFNQTYVDIDEWRNKPVRHRYVHGGFKGTKALFSFYFPPKEQYQGRFFQYVTPVPTSENLAQPNSGAEDKMALQSPAESALRSQAEYISLRQTKAVCLFWPGIRRSPGIV